MPIGWAGMLKIAEWLLDRPMTPCVLIRVGVLDDGVMGATTATAFVVA